ncbi:hypothetical protein ['Catharanthus roseus' aster yellows phytoplasma]|uniref:Uncharacterized protein n=1 Tax='Catharanthus roseus' aster yellows phytoplasma TaxID=1193712 RepID=A0A4P6MAD6_9MOLU|nr:hypothetical protein ['Catharanthus roseus' aster yellows phytoplasma]QBF23957.1 hypothetical protein EXT02_02060 ['Catharanthus roseus' aster yellows phytoplasma]
MKKYNLFDNFICLLMGAIIGIFLYINFFQNEIKQIEIETPSNNIKYIDLTVSQKLDLIKKIKK